MAHLHLNELSLICDMWLNKITYLLTYLEQRIYPGCQRLSMPALSVFGQSFSVKSVKVRRPHLAVRGFVKKNNRLLAVYSRSSNEAFRWQNKYCTKTFCVNLRKLTKEFYVRFGFGIIVTACIQFSSLLAKYFTHKKNSF